MMSGAGDGMPLPLPFLLEECEEEQLAVMCTASQGLSSLAKPEGSKDLVTGVSITRAVSSCECVHSTS